MTQLLKQLALESAGRIINPVEFQSIFQRKFPDSYWLTEPQTYDCHFDRLAMLEELLADDSSRDLLRRVVEFRLTGNYAALPEPTPDEQYCPADLPRWQEPLRVVDGGAFDGDTLRQVKRHGYAFEQIVAFEPDPVSYSRLSRCIEDLGGGVCLPCGLVSRLSVPFAHAWSQLL